MIPGFAPCGYVVDFLRACYSHDRKLFRNNPAALTRGRYYFAPDGAPAFPTDNIFGSYYWMRGELLEDPELGEPIESNRVMYNGDPPPIVPVPRICGPLEYFTEGDPNGPQVGINACMHTPPASGEQLPLRITNAVGSFAVWDNAEGIFEREDTPGQTYLADVDVLGFVLELQLGCVDAATAPGVYYGVGMTFPTIENLGVNRPDSWRNPLRLVFDCANNSGSFTLTVGNLPSAPPPRVWGILDCCLPTGVPPVPSALSHFDLNDPAVLYMLAALEAAVYQPDVTAALDIATAWLGAPLQFDFVNALDQWHPGTFVARYPGFTLAVVEGSTNELQLALQVLFSVAGPVDCGQYSTNPIWRSANRFVHDRLLLTGVDPSAPVLLVGHSYGAAVAWTLATDYLVAQPGRQVKCVVMGMPKPGDVRLQALSRDRGFRSLETVGDPVPSIPPDVGWWSAFAPVTTQAVLNNWARFKSGGIVGQIQGNGAIVDTDDDPAFWLDMLQVAANFVAPIPGLIFIAHLVGNYAHLLSLGAGTPVSTFPVSPAALAVARGHFP